MVLRSRVTADELACVRLLTRVHEHDGYPRHLPGSPAAFLFAAHETSAWVCEIDGEIVGHVALHSAGSDPVLDLAQRATGLPTDSIAVVARLLVSPAHRRQGIGRALLDLATAHARDDGQRAVLDVAADTAAAPAAALYQQAGWTIAGGTTFRFRDGASLDVQVWVSADQ